MDSFISEVHPITDSDLFAVNLCDNPSSRCVVEFVGMAKTNAHLRGLAQNRFRNGMFRIELRDRRGFKQRLRSHTISGPNLHNLGCSVGQRACLVEENRIDLSKCFQVQAALDNCAVLRGAADGTQDCQRSSRCDSACSGYNYNGDGRARVMCDDKSDAAAANAKYTR